MNKFYGKYRAIVSEVHDTEFRGRIKVRCPKVYGEFESPWCLPCVPFAFDKGGIFMIPHLNEVVWIEFEEGNPEFPIWTGSWWAEEKAPLDKALYPSQTNINKIFKSRSGHLLQFVDWEGNEQLIIRHSSGNEIIFEGNEQITIKHSSGSEIMFEANGEIKIKHSSGSEMIFEENGEITIKGKKIKLVEEDQQQG